MKKYNTPEIEALALETIDVIATSGHDAAFAALEAVYTVDEKANIAEFTNADLSDQWSW